MSVIIIHDYNFISALDASRFTPGLAGEHPSCARHQQNRPSDHGAETHTTRGVHTPAEDTGAGDAFILNVIVC